MCTWLLNFFHHEKVKTVKVIEILRKTPLDTIDQYIDKTRIKQS